MQIPSLRQSETALSTIGGTDLVSGGANQGPLTRNDITMIKKATGMDFAWPPTADSTFPQAAYDLSVMRTDQLARRMPIADLSAADLKVLGTAGKLDPAFVAQALNYLKAQDSAAAHQADTTGQSSPQSGAFADDGSIYL